MNLIMKSIDEKVSQIVFLIIEALKLNIMIYDWPSLEEGLV